MKRTPDGQLVDINNGIEEEEGVLYVKGTMVVKDVSEDFSDKSTILLGRSGQAQLGINVMSDNWEAAEFKDGNATIPLKIESFGDLDERLLHTFIRQTQAGVKLNVGRLINPNGEKALNQEATLAAIEAGDIRCPGTEGEDYKVNEDGSISFRLHPGVFILNHKALKGDSQLLDHVIKHGRDGINEVQDFVQTGPRLIRNNELFIGGIRVSTGKYCALIRSEVSDGVCHLPGGRFFDAYRAARVGDRYGSSGLRQVEIVNRSKQPIEKASLWLTIDIYPTGEDNKLDQYFQNRTDKEFIHEHGPSFIQATQLDNPETLDQLFEGVSPTRDEDALYGRVITRNGITPIEWADTEKFQKSDSNRAVQNLNSGIRTQDDRFKNFIKGLGETKDQGRVFVCHNLPSSDQLITLKNSGVRSFIFKGIRSRAEDFVDGAESLTNNVYLNDHLYQTIRELEREGISFVFAFEQLDEAGDKIIQLREFYKGFWCLPEAKQKLDKIEVVVDMYGWHKDNLAEATRAEIKTFFEGLIETFGKEKLAIAHGKGPGFMRIADEVARELGIFSMGVGIDVEKLEQQANFDPEAVLDFQSSERLARQKLLDQLGTFYAFNIGGNGTKEESSITQCSTKLCEYLPGPLVFIDGSEGDHLWESECRQVTDLATKDVFVYKNSEGEEFVFDITNHPLTLRWMQNMVYPVKTYAEALEIWQDFVNDPVRFWEKTGVIATSDKETPGDRYDTILLAWERQLKLEKDTERNIPGFFQEAIAQIEDHKAALIEQAKIK